LEKNKGGQVDTVALRLRLPAQQAPCAWPNQPFVFPKARKQFLLLLGEKAAMREDDEAICFLNFPQRENCYQAAGSFTPGLSVKNSLITCKTLL
jgi:hypothetical protein